MTVRTSMITLVSQLKNLTDLANYAPTATSRQNEFTDDDVQRFLDMNKQEYRQVQILPTPIRVGNSMLYLDYFLPEFLGLWFETPQIDTTNPYFNLQDDQFNIVLFGDGAGKAQFDPYLRKITFNSNTEGRYYFLTTQAYDLYGAAADIWNVKISRRTPLVAIKTDNQSIAMQTEYEHCQERYKYYKGLSAKNGTTLMVRTDQVFPAGDSPIVKGFAPVSYLETL